MSGARNMVVSVRLDEGSVHILDLLVTSGVARSRSEATARLVQIGIGASSSLLEHVREVANTAHLLREEFGTAGDSSPIETDEVRATVAGKSADFSDASDHVDDNDDKTDSAASNAGRGSGGSGGSSGSAGGDGRAGGDGSAGGDSRDTSEASKKDRAVDDDFIRPYREAIETTRERISRGEFDVFHAATLEDPSHVVAMIERDPDLLHQHDENGWTPLHVAALFDRLRTTIALVGLGADLSAQSNNELRATPLHSAAIGWNRAAAEMLLLHGADVNAQQSNGWTPLHIAAFHGNEMLIQLLLQYGADPSTRSLKGETPFDIAMKYGRKRVASQISRAHSSRR